MELMGNVRYLATLKNMHTNFPLWGALNRKTLLISGATGMLGSLLIDTIMLRNQDLLPENRSHIIALGRNQKAAKRRFAPWQNRKEFSFISHDIALPMTEIEGKIDYLVHAASPADPIAYISEPINTICANMFGTRNMLDCSLRQKGARFLLCSSVEIYGENRGDVERFKEDYCGYLNCNTLRAGYPEGKRVSESLCQAYITEKDADAVIIRLPRCYGPTMRTSDSKALAQFIRKAVAKEDIILKSAGNQLFSFLYAVDAVLALLWVLMRGETGEAYNAAEMDSDITLFELAHTVATKAGVSVRFEMPEGVEQSGYSVATKALLDAEKLRRLGWKSYYDLATGIDETIQILESMN